jgi:nucleoid-associated protein YgaU
VGRWLTTAGVRRLVAGVVGGGLLLAPVDVGAEVREPPPSEAPVLRRLPDTTEPAHEPAPAAPPSAGEQPGEVVVSPGDHLWAIAERTLAARLGRAPSDAEIVPFWRALIELNRDRLRTGDPDLIFVGDRFVLPS